MTTSLSIKGHEHRSFAACGADTTSMQYRVETALAQLFQPGPLYKKIETAASCLSGLRKSDFPKEIADDVTVLFSVHQHVRHLGPYRDSSP